jgi:dipeptidyl-peptidase-4
LRLLSAPLVGFIAALYALLAAVPVGARTDVQKPLLGVDEIFAPEPLTGRLPASITWAPDGTRFLYTLPGGETGPLDTHLYNTRAHSDRIFLRAAAEGKGARPAPEFVWSPDSRRLAYLDAGNLWVVDADGSHRKELVTDADDPQWSPDSARVAYVHASDIYAVAAGGGKPVRFSTDGGPDTVNGDPDWVYSEELEMRHAFAWSPDGRRIAYLRFDERPIAPFPIVDFLPPVNTVDEQRYPLAGASNSIVTLRIGSPGGTARDLYSTKANDDYVASVGWTPGGEVVADVLDRSQRRLRYLRFGAANTSVLLTENDAKWVDFHGPPRWLRDGHRFLFVSDRGGQTALYLADTNGATIKRLTHGYAVMSIAAVDEPLHVAFVEAAYPTRRDTTVLLVPLRGGRPRPLAGGSGHHGFTFAGNGRDFVRSDSAFGVPPMDTIGSTLGGGLTPFVKSTSLADRGLGSYELGQIDSPYGKLDTWTIKPPDFNPAKQYPVVMYVYGGPAAPTTADSWGGSIYLYHQALAQRGYIVFSIDGPGSQIDSAAAVRRLYHRLGPASLAGQVAGANYLKSLPYVDPDRIGIWGWSFGGYETTFAMTHATGIWKAGIAVAPVTDWIYYDSIYTERYMGTPLQNPRAYRDSSVLDAAGAFDGRLLISQGTSDDNVHLANSVSLLQALVLKGKQVDYMIYPRKTHGISGIPQRRHLFTHMLEYWQEHL